MRLDQRLPTILHWGGVALLVGGALGFVAFGPRSSRALPPDRVVVTYWEKWTDFEGEAIHRLVALFNETAGAEQGLYVDHLVTTQIDIKTAVATAGGDPPDLVGLWSDLVGSFAVEGALQPLDEVARDAGVTADTIVPVYYDSCRHHGQLYAVPLTPWSIALYYNKGLFREFADALRAAGYDPQRPPRTPDELLGYARVMVRRNPSQKHAALESIGFLPLGPDSLGWYFHTWPLLFGGRFLDERGQLRIDDPVSIRAFEWVQRFASAAEFGNPADPKSRPIDEVLKFESALASFNSPDNPFMIGKLAMLQQGPWFASFIRKFAPEIDFGVAPFPTDEGCEASYCGQDVLAIPSGARHPREAAAFIRWLYTAPPVVVPSGRRDPQFGYEYYTVRTEAGVERRPMPALRPIEWLCWNHFKNGPLLRPSREFLETHPNPYVAVHEELARRRGAFTDPPLPNWYELREEYRAAYRDIWTGGAPAGQRLRRAQQRIDQLTERARKQLAYYGVEYP